MAQKTAARWMWAVVVAALVGGGAIAYLRLCNDPKVTIATRSTGIEPRFDLVCSGYSVKREVEPFEARVRIDLSSGYSCIDDCSSAMPVVRASPHELLLWYDRNRHLAYDSISREAGSRLRYTDYFGSNHDRTATCRTEAFSGFPEQARARISNPRNLAMAANWSRYPAPEALAAMYPAWRKLLGLGADIRVRCTVGRGGVLVGCRPNGKAAMSDAYTRALARQFVFAEVAWPDTNPRDTSVELSIKFDASHSAQ